MGTSTSRVDRIIKLREYGEVESIRSYVILDMDAAAVMVFENRPDNTWQAISVTSEEIISLPTLGIDLPMAELYAGLSA